MKPLAVRLQLPHLLAKLEFHEWLSVYMFAFCASLYAFGLHESLFGVVTYTLLAGSPIPKLFLASLLGFALVLLVLPAHPLVQAGKFVLRILTSFLLMLFFFEAITHFITVRELPLRDALLQQWDARLFFGKQPAVWLEAITSAPLTMLLSAAYLSWFLFVYGTVFLLLCKGKRAVLHYTASALLTYYIGYLLYLLVPGLGPLYTYDFHTPLGGLTAVLANREWVQPSADVFPSLHAALSVVMLVNVWRHYRAFTFLYAPLALLILFSTLYLRLHYGVDVIAGILLALVVTQVCPRLLQIRERPQAQYANTTIVSR